ncbi:hypothetical protein LC087_12885 [Bacillus carboniphilus]|uniref:Uncharacterized protein n=1 Tax=Bacillus carboniphilus TaxID=86663 RepID=A0ABY9JVS9_9BACI|nr:hypothetical protein [Bacillus carboniphilus]WLR41750.1 hypothetical protein LC087_12885 [Bacillus carboniphilus]
MDRYKVTFEMTNGDEHNYLIDSESSETVENLKNSENGWIEIEDQGETHFIKEDKVTRFKMICVSDISLQEI